MKTLDRVVALIFGLLLLGGGGLLIVGVVQAESGHRPVLDWPGGLHTLRTTGFDNGIAITAFAATLVLGVLLLAAAVRKRPAPLIQLQDHRVGPDDEAWWLRRGGLERYLSQTVLKRTPAKSARVRLRPGRRLDAEFAPHPGAEDLHPTHSQADEVEQCLDLSLLGLALTEPMQVRVRVAGRGGRS